MKLAGGKISGAAVWAVFSIVLNYFLLYFLTVGALDINIGAILAQPGTYVWFLIGDVGQVFGLVPFDGMSGLLAFESQGYYYILFFNIIIITVLEAMVLAARSARRKRKRKAAGAPHPPDQPTEITSIVFDSDFCSSRYFYSFKSVLFLLIALFFLTGLTSGFLLSSPLVSEFTPFEAWSVMPVIWAVFRVMFFTLLRLVLGLFSRRVFYSPRPSPANIGRRYIAPVFIPLFRMLIIIFSGWLSGLIGMGLFPDFLYLF